MIQSLPCSLRKRRDGSTVLVFLVVLVFFFSVAAARPSALASTTDAIHAKTTIPTATTFHYLCQTCFSNTVSHPEEGVLLPKGSPASKLTVLLQVRGGSVGGVAVTLLKTAIRNPILILRKSKVFLVRYTHSIYYNCAFLIPLKFLFVSSERMNVRTTPTPQSL